MRFITVLGLFLWFDCMRPFHFALRAELLFLGILMLALHAPRGPALGIALFFGILHDLLIPFHIPLHTLWYGGIVLAAQSLLRHFHMRSVVQFALAAGALVLYAAMNSVAYEYDWRLSVLFLGQSFLLYYGMSRRLPSWILASSPVQ